MRSIVVRTKAKHSCQLATDSELGASVADEMLDNARQP
jgi:hypothetical protein